MAPSLCHRMFQCHAGVNVWCGFILKAVLFMAKSVYRIIKEISCAVYLVVGSFSHEGEML